MWIVFGVVHFIGLLIATLSFGGSPYISIMWYVWMLFMLAGIAIATGAWEKSNEKSHPDH